MLKYFIFLWLNVLKKKAILITTLVFFAFLFTIFNLVPAILDFAWYYIWDNTAFNLHDFVYIILSIICAEIIINVFADPRSNGSELIIIAKPINRIKIILTKFIVILSIGFILIFISSIFIISAGPWTSKMSDILTHYLMAVIIIFLLFSSVAVIANTFTSKIGILCITIGMAILMSVMHMTIPLTVKTQTDYLQEQYGLNFKVRPLMTSKNRQPQIKKNVGLNVFSDNNNTYDIIQKINQKTDHFVETYLDVGGQMNKLFFATDVNDSVFNWFGSETNLDYEIINESLYDNLITYRDSNFTEGYNPLILPKIIDSNTPYVMWAGYSNAAHFANNFEYQVYQTGGLTERSMIYYHKLSSLTYYFVDYDQVYDINRWNDYEYANYIFDKYIWYGSNDMDEFGYKIDNYALNTLESGEISLFAGFRPNNVVEFDHLSCLLDALLCDEDPYRNDRQVHTMYYPYIPPYNQDLIAEQNHIYDTYDPQLVPDFDANIAAGIDWAHKTASTRYHPSTAIDDQSYLITPKIRAALGPYQYFEWSPNSREGKLMEVSQAAMKLIYLFMLRFSNIFYNPSLYVDTTDSELANWKYWENGYQDEYFLQADQSFTTNPPLINWLYYIAFWLTGFNNILQNIYPDSAPNFFDQQTTTDPNIQVKIDQSKANHNYYTSRLYNSYGMDNFPYIGIDDLKQSYFYDARNIITNEQLMIAWCFITLVIFSTIVVIYIRTDFQ